MFSMKVVDRQKQITVHKAVLRKVEAVRDLFKLAGDDLHLEASKVVDVLNEVICEQGSQRLGQKALPEPAEVEPLEVV